MNVYFYKIFSSLGIMSATCQRTSNFSGAKGSKNLGAHLKKVWRGTNVNDCGAPRSQPVVLWSTPTFLTWCGIICAPDRPHHAGPNGRFLIWLKSEGISFLSMEVYRPPQNHQISMDLSKPFAPFQVPTVSYTFISLSL